MPKIYIPTKLGRKSWVRRKPCPPDEDRAPRVSHWIWAAANAFKLRNLPEEVAFDLIQGSIPPTRVTAKRSGRISRKRMAQPEASVPIPLDAPSLPTIPSF